MQTTKYLLAGFRLNIKSVKVIFTDGIAVIFSLCFTSFLIFSFYIMKLTIGDSPNRMN